MTWLYIPDMESASAPDTAASTSGSNSQANTWAENIALSCTARGKHSLARYWLNKRRKDPWTMLLSGATLPPYRQEESLTAWLSTRRKSLSTGASPASHSPAPASQSGKPTSGTSGLPSGISQRKAEWDGSCWKTSGGLFPVTFQGLTACFQTCPKPGGMRNGIVFLRLIATRPINVSGFSSWHTPNVPNGGRRIPDRAEWSGKAAYLDGKKCQVELKEQVKADWPSPAMNPPTRDTTNGENVSKTTGTKYGLSIVQAVMDEHAKKLNWDTPDTMPMAPCKGSNRKAQPAGLYNQVTNWPTPKACEGEKPSAGNRQGNDLTRQVKSGLPDQESSSTDGNQQGSWTTPCSDDTGHRKKKYGQGGTALSMQAQGKLNPDWVECLMGLPVNWTNPYGRTDFGVSGMDAYLSKWLWLLSRLLGD